MQPKPSDTGVRKSRKRAQLSCTECRRRKQKCNPRSDGNCGNCIRRYPPVQCIFLPDPKKPKEDRDVVVPELRGPAPAPLGNESVSSSSSRSPPRHQAVSLGRTLKPSHDVDLSGTPGLSSHSDLELEVASTLSLNLGSSSRENKAYGPSTHAHDKDSSPSDLENNGIVQFRRPSSSSPTPFAGALTQINGMHGAYIRDSMRNAELWNFFHYSVVPSMCSVDGSNTPALFTREMLPWMIQSPLMPHIAILMSSAFQMAEPELQLVKPSETIAIKSQVLALINDFLRQDFNVVGREALRAVIHLVVVEWWWGSTSSLWAHMKGIKQMIKLRGGFQALDDHVLQQVFLVTDFELACCFEHDLFLIDPMMANHMPIPIPPTYPEPLRSPLLEYPETFRHGKMVFGTSIEAVEILDDVRFLTLSITSPSDTSSTDKIQSTAAWLHKRISSTPSPNSPPTSIITSMIHLITQIYTLSISTLIPISQLWTPSLIEDFYTNLHSLPMSQWKSIPGIFLWIMLVACPGSEEDARGKWLRRKMAVAGMQVGMEDFGVAIACLRQFWRVQRWVENEGRKKRGIDGEGGDEVKFRRFA